jgi:hypothetical protein
LGGAKPPRETTRGAQPKEEVDPERVKLRIGKNLTETTERRNRYGREKDGKRLAGRRNQGPVLR